ncbi:protein transport protein Sec24C isoform X2 [Clupea harengus]|uniref:Protein transport protein Sec24C isoform X2 n=1 Tax=Clupea harengus TaxID=7950 RepID=A0A6P8FSZ8_CLUHA|nr:protein transport protein Sec24C isoform X2 [Clupea harengus]
MDIPASSPTYGQEGLWGCYYGWAPSATPPLNSPAGFPNTFQTPYQCQMNTCQVGPASSNPLSHPQPVGQTGPPPGLQPAGTGGLQRPNHWNTSYQDQNGGLFRPAAAADVAYKAQSSSEKGAQPETKPTSPSSESRYGLDPQLLPSAVQVMQEDQTEWEGKAFASEAPSNLPPLSTTDCIIEDKGNASPRFIRCTTYTFPSEAQSAQHSHLPLGAILTPLAQQHKAECPVPVCEEGGCLRGCVECGAYMCRSMAWQDCGQRFHCPFCGKHNEVPWQVYQPTDALSRRVDAEKRPELSLGSYEILEQNKDETASLLLAVDVSDTSLRAGQLESICQQLHTLVDTVYREEGTDQCGLRVGLLTYDHRIHLYNLSASLSRPHMLVVTDTDELELPLTEGLLVPLSECKHIIQSVLQQIPLFTSESQDSTYIPQDAVVSTGLQILQAVGCPGKLLVFHSSPLSEIPSRPASSGFFSSTKPKSLFQPSDSAVSLAKACVSQGCSVHLFLFAQQDVGGAWPGDIPHLTGGGLFYYNSLLSKVEKERLHCDLTRIVETFTVYKAQLRVFTSKELSVSGCYGSFIPSGCPGLVAMAALDWHTTLALEFTHSRPLSEGRGVAIQVVLSYTNPHGEKRTRVHSLSLRCSASLLDCFRNSQAETVLTFYCKKMYCAVVERPLQCLREELQAEVTELLACYRKNCSSVSSGQLVLPAFLKALPVYVNSLRKSEVVLPGVRSSVHQRLLLRSRILSMDTKNTVTHFYPQVFALCVGDEHPCVVEAVRCSASGLDPCGLYLAYCPSALVLWVGQGVSRRALMELFGNSCFSAVTSGEIKLLILDTPLSVHVRTLIDTLQANSPFTVSLKVVRQGDSCEDTIQRLLIEDKSPNGGASYADFLYHLHINSLRLLV